MATSLARRLSYLVLGAFVLTAGACVHIFRELKVVSLPRPAASAADTIRSPVKAHLADGSTVLFPRGALVSATTLSGAGLHFPLLSTEATARETVPMDSVVAVEAFQGGVQVGTSLVVSAASTALSGVALVAAAFAIFGSCPTVYSDTGTGLELQAEGFSYALSPLMEHRDVDPLRAKADAQGVIRLELRNEALETHYLNHIEVLAAEHGVGERVVPDHGGRPVTVRGFAELSAATDRSGRDVRDVLSLADGSLYATAPGVSAAVREGDLDDWIDLDIGALPPGDSVVVLLRLRNSLLNTILLYEGMLGGRDAPDWLTTNLNNISRTVDLARWYAATMGMRVTVDGVPRPSDSPFEGHARFSDVGPIAFRDVAVVLPRPSRDATKARVRLRFVADNWRIDEVRVAGALARPLTRSLAVTAIELPTQVDGMVAALDTAGLPAVQQADDSYYVTHPGQRMTLVFAPDLTASSAAPGTRTYLIAWQGWYSEWIRGSWLADPKRSTPFVPGDAAMLQAMSRWQAEKETFERAFYSSAIPVR